MMNKIANILQSFFGIIGLLSFFGIFFAQFFLSRTVGLYIISVCFFSFAIAFFIKYTREVQKISLRVVLVSSALLSISAFAAFGIYQNAKVKTIYEFDMQRTSRNTFQGTFNIPMDMPTDEKEHKLAAELSVYSSRKAIGSYDFITTLQTPQNTTTRKFSLSPNEGYISFEIGVGEAFLPEDGNYSLTITPTENVPASFTIRSIHILVREP